MTGALAGVLFAAGCYLVLRRDRSRVIFGLVLLGHAISLLLLTGAAPRAAGAAIVPVGAQTVAAPTTDPLPQALALTAVVIAFATTIVAAALVGGLDERAGARESDDDPEGRDARRAPSAGGRVDMMTAIEALLAADAREHAGDGQAPR